MFLFELLWLLSLKYGTYSKCVLFMSTLREHFLIAHIWVNAFSNTRQGRDDVLLRSHACMTQQHQDELLRETFWTWWDVTAKYIYSSTVLITVGLVLRCQTLLEYINFLLRYTLLRGKYCAFTPLNLILTLQMQIL